MDKAAIYLRSSKDRSDVSISSQRRELKTFAKKNQYRIIAEYSDTVESAKDEFRPDFQRLMRDMRNPARTWTVLLATDTSRISRRTHFAHALRHEARKRGIEVVYSKLPLDLDPVSEVIIYSTLTAMDEVHSLISREKGLAGMAENVRNGWRAGGRAPFGYQLVDVGTGTMRDGAEVMKTRLEPDAKAGQARRYLQARAQGATRRSAIDASGIERATSTLVGMEWQALTYAGATVWNVHNERLPDGSYRGGSKRKPRADWMIQRDTHKALISWEDADAIVGRLEGSAIGRAVSEAKTGNSTYLLTGLLAAPNGDAWTGIRKTHYRFRGTHGSKGRTVACQAVDDLVLKQITEDTGADEFIAAMTEAARAGADIDPAERKELQARLESINTSIDSAMTMAEQLADAGPALRRIDSLEVQRKQIAEDLQHLEQEHEARRRMAQIREIDVRNLLDEVWQDLRNADPVHIKPVLRSLIGRVELDPESLEITIHYRIERKCPSMASPRGFEPLLPP